VYLFTSETPTSTNVSEGSPLTVAMTFYVTSAGYACAGGRFFAPLTVTGTFELVLWEATNEDAPVGSGEGIQRATVAFGALTPGAWNEVLFTTPYALTVNKAYKIGVRTSQGRYTATNSFFNSDKVNGVIRAPQTNLLNTDIGGTYYNGTFVAGTSDYPDQTFNGSNYFIDPKVELAGASTTPVTSSLTAKWRVYGKMTSPITVKWRVYGKVTSSLTAKWRVFQRVTSSLTAKWRMYQKVTSILTGKWRMYGKVSTSLTGKWRIYGIVSTTFTSKWRVFSRVASRLTAKWTNFGAPAPEPVVSNAYLAAQRVATAAFIRDDPTTLVLIPRSRMATPTGGYTYVDGAPRSAQTVKMILLSSDQRPTVTVAGVERLIDYHMVGPWDMQVAVGDTWDSEYGTRWEVLGFSEGWDYMTKAFVGRHVPRGGKP
jgi:hypothetical protein